MQLNDYWPSASQSLIDYYGYSKPAIYEIKGYLSDISVFYQNGKVYATNKNII